MGIALAWALSSCEPRVATAAPRFDDPQDDMEANTAKGDPEPNEEATTST